MAFIKQSVQLICRPAVYLPPKEKDKVFQIPFNAEYLRRLKNRDPEIGNHFYSYFQPRLQTKLRSRRLAESDVQDIMQETFARVLKGVRDDTVQRPEAFAGFVNAVCDNIVKDFWKVPRKLPSIDTDEIDPPDPTPTADMDVLRRERQELVERILTDLSPKDRNLLRANFEGLSRDEMCSRFGASSPDRLRVMLHRARGRFAKSCRKRGLDFFH